MPVPPLRTARLRLDPVDPERDAADLARLWADPRFSAFEISDPPADRAQVLQRFGWVDRMPPGLGGWVLRWPDPAGSDRSWHPGRPGLVGRVSLRQWEHDPAGPPELGWHLAPAYWGRGLATEAMTAVLEHARTVVGLDRTIALVRVDNRPSRAVAERLGGVVRDQGEWYGPGWTFVRYDVPAPARTSGGGPPGSMGGDPMA